jgi:hypothetical protein
MPLRLNIIEVNETRLRNALSDRDDGLTPCRGRQFGPEGELKSEQKGNFDRALEDTHPQSAAL